MKILAIIGSPRKGTTYRVTKRIAERLEQTGNIGVEFLFLSDINFGDCIGCQLCCTHGEDFCPLKDDRAKLEKMMMNADGIILASPTYAMQVSALMKTFLDHFAYLFHRPRFFGKKALLVVTGGGGTKDALNCMENSVRGWGFYLTCRVATLNPDVFKPKYRDKQWKKVDQAADKYIQSLNHQTLPSPSLKDMIMFRVWQVSSAEPNHALPADHNYWKENGWLDKEYYDDVAIFWPKRVIAKLFKLLMTKMTKKYFA